MDTLILLRHAEADFASGSVSDFDRPLNSNGLKEAEDIGRQLVSQNRMADVILCSSATRAKQTCDGVFHQQRDAETPSYYRELYLAPLNTLLDISVEWAARADTLMIIGHNPGLESFLKYLCGSDLPYDANGTLFSTGNCAVITLAGGIVGGKGSLVALLRPQLER